ncbi:hypothetical protein EVAR_51255_1 [Eumeta japonica]|uniref:Uncharacterized protein n=1 Tax=Eumeta variegata TaxID=151549 RepID=A0A4C1X0Z2_EUMVA|nr:hypothetical protein EVAR_51255_1 [Eumeta japonica]
MRIHMLYPHLVPFPSRWTSLRARPLHVRITFDLGMSENLFISSRKRSSDGSPRGCSAFNPKAITSSRAKVFLITSIPSSDHPLQRRKETPENARRLEARCKPLLSRSRAANECIGSRRVRRLEKHELSHIADDLVKLYISLQKRYKKIRVYIPQLLATPHCRLYFRGARIIFLKFTQPTYRFLKLP